MAETFTPLKGKEVLRKLQKAGFKVIRIRGSAHYLHNPITHRFTSVHIHGGKDIPVPLLRKIVVHQAKLTIEEWNQL